MTHKLTAALLLFFAYPACLKAQENTQYEEFTDYKKLGFNISPALYSKSRITRSYGDYILDNHKTAGINFGFDYLIHPERKWAFKTGLHLDLVPMYNISFTIRPEDLYPEYGAINERVKGGYHPAFTIPVLVQIKKQMAYNLYFSLEAGCHIMIMQDGGYDVSYAFSNAEETELREVFAMYANTTNPVNVYPNLVISPGFYLMLYDVLIQGSLIFQKPPFALFKGEYQFGNLLESPPTRGNFKQTGEYIGLSISVHLRKKTRQRLHKSSDD